MVRKVILSSLEFCERGFSVTCREKSHCIFLYQWDTFQTLRIRPRVGIRLCVITFVSWTLHILSSHLYLSFICLQPGMHIYYSWDYFGLLISQYHLVLQDRLLTFKMINWNYQKHARSACEVDEFSKLY